MPPKGEPLPDPGSMVSKILLRKSRRQLLIAPEHNAQLWMWLVTKVKSDAVKSNIAQEPRMLGPQIKANQKWPKGDGKSEHQYFRNQQTKMDWNDLI